MNKIDPTIKNAKKKLQEEEDVTFEKYRQIIEKKISDWQPKNADDTVIRIKFKTSFGRNYKLSSTIKDRLVEYFKKVGYNTLCSFYISANGKTLILRIEIL